MTYWYNEKLTNQVQIKTKDLLLKERKKNKLIRV